MDIHFTPRERVYVNEHPSPRKKVQPSWYTKELQYKNMVARGLPISDPAFKEKEKSADVKPGIPSEYYRPFGGWSSVEMQRMRRRFDKEDEELRKLSNERRLKQSYLKLVRERENCSCLNGPEFTKLLATSVQVSVLVYNRIITRLLMRRCRLRDRWVWDRWYRLVAGVSGLADKVSKVLLRR